LEEGVDLFGGGDLYGFLFGLVGVDVEVGAEEFVPAVEGFDVVVEGAVGGAVFEAEGEVGVDGVFGGVGEVEAVGFEVFEFADGFGDGGFWIELLDGEAVSSELVPGVSVYILHNVQNTILGETI